MSDRIRVILTLAVLFSTYHAVRMIHRRKLNLNYSLMWIVLAVLMLIAIIFPETVYWLSGALGIELPLNMLLIGFAFFSMLMLFYLTSIVSRDNEKNRALTQEIALLEKRVRDLEARQPLPEETKDRKAE